MDQMPFHFDYRSTGPSDKQAAEKSYQSLHRRISAYEQQASGRIRIRLRAYQTAAAVLLIAASCLGFLWIRTIWHQQGTADVMQLALARSGAQDFFSPAGTRSRVLLSDSSIVWLNSGSHLAVENGFGLRNRQIRLEGEAYFEVAGNKALPFIVSAHGIEVKALGTSFTVSAYANSNTVETVLLSGATEVKTPGYAGLEQEVLHMRPSQKLSVQKKDHSLYVEDDIDPEDYTGWIQNKLIYRDTPLEDVARSLERWFNLVIILQDQTIKSYTYTGTFENRSIEQILSYIKYTSPLTYTMKKDTITLKLK